jgi:hypothetical protein
VGHVLEHAALLHAGRLLAALHVHADGRLDLLVQADLEQVDVHDLVADRVQLLILHDHRAGLAADLEVDQRLAAHEHLPKGPRVHFEGGAVAVLAAVDHTRHEALPAQALHRASAALGALLDVESGSFCIGHDGWPV